MNMQACTRRSFLFASLAAPLAAQRSQKRLNVLMISVDDWNDWVGALGGHPQVKTPNMDRLAARGVLFADAHTAAPICNPSRAALMTGRRPVTSGVYDNNQPWRLAMPDVVTLPQHFRANGYYAAGGGKVYHHGRGYNDPKSWDDYFFWNPQGREKGWHDGYSFPPDPEPERPVTPMPSVSWRNFDWAPVDVSDEQMPDYKVATWAGDYLRSDHEKPFFLAVGLFRPHIPWFVPKKYFDMYPLEEVIVPTVKQDDLEDVPPAAWKMALNPESSHHLLVSTGNWKKAVQSYLACISFSDAMLGRVLDALDAGPHKDSTIVALWSDHGYHLGEKWHWHKQALWNRATHVPLMFAGPGIEPERRCERTVSLIDVYPTLADLAGLPAPAGVDGKSLRPLLENPQLPREEPVLITFLRGNHAVRNQRWSYIRYAEGGEELYDLRQDPNEWVNLANRPELQNVKQKLAAAIPAKQAPNSPRAEEYQFDSKTLTWRPKRG